VPDDYIDQVFAVMALASQHTFQVLTKRAARLPEYFRDRDPGAIAYWMGRIAKAQDCIVTGARRLYDITQGGEWPLPNVWLGVSVENQHFADARIPLLLQTPAAIRFISAEPLLEAIDLTPHLVGATLAAPGPTGFRPGPRLDWVIVGGESGRGARAFDLEWGRSLVAQCQEARVPVFVKQLGAHAFEGELENGGCGPLYGLRDTKGADLEEWPVDLRVREFPGTS